MLMSLCRLLLVSCLSITSLYAPSQLLHAKNSASWIYKNKTKRYSAGTSAITKVRSKETRSKIITLHKQAKKTRIALKKCQMQVEEMLGA